MAVKYEVASLLYSLGRCREVAGTSAPVTEQAPGEAAAQSGRIFGLPLFGDNGGKRMIRWLTRWSSGGEVNPGRNWWELTSGGGDAAGDGMTLENVDDSTVGGE